MSQVAVHEITIGDTLEALNAILYDDNRNPIELSSDTVKFGIWSEAEAVVLAATETGVTKQPTKTVTLDSTNNWIYSVAHGFATGNVVVPATSGSLSGTGLTAATRYKVVETDTDWFRVSLRSGGVPVTIAGAGTGNHTFYIVGSVQFDFAAAEVDTAGEFRGRFVRSVGGETAHKPNHEDFIRISVK